MSTCLSKKLSRVITVFVATLNLSCYSYYYYAENWVVPDSAMEDYTEYMNMLESNSTSIVDFKGIINKQGIKVKAHELAFNFYAVKTKGLVKVNHDLMDKYSEFIPIYKLNSTELKKLKTLEAYVKRSVYESQ